MPRYIDADIAIKELEKRFYFLSRWISFETKDVIKKIPTADVRENVHGKWERNKDGCYCSKCHLGWDYITGIPGDLETKYKFCPNCGAVMDMKDELGGEGD